MHSVNLFQTANASKALRAYSKPKMTTYGSVVEMTASGSLGAAEATNCSNVGQSTKLSCTSAQKP
jgi:hypothetical protein